MSFQQQLEKILDEQFKRLDGTTVLPIYNRPTAVDQALTSIINLVDKELPKFIDVGKYDLDCPPADLHRAAGYNQALTDMRNKLRGEIDGN